jgi:hypothetical protein
MMQVEDSLAKYISYCYQCDILTTFNKLLVECVYDFGNNRFRYPEGP